MIITKEKVRFVETDLMGVVHHSNYFRWFESARVHYFDLAKVDLVEIMDGGVVFPIKMVECQYHQPAHFNDTIRIETTLEKITRAQIIFYYEIFRDKDNTLLATGRTQSVTQKKENGTIFRLDKKSIERLENVEKKEGV